MEDNIALFNLDAIVKSLLLDTGSIEAQKIPLLVKQKCNVEISIDDIFKYIHTLKIDGFIECRWGEGTNVSLSFYKYAITVKGELYGTYSKFYEERETQKELDSKLKSISIDSIQSNKNFPLWGLVVAVIAILAPIIMHYFTKNDVQNTNTTIPTLQQIEQTQEHMSLMLQERMDSLIKTVHYK